MGSYSYGVAIRECNLYVKMYVCRYYVKLYVCVKAWVVITGTRTQSDPVLAQECSLWATRVGNYRD